MCVSTKDGVEGCGSSLFYSTMPSYLDTQSMCLSVRRSGAGSEDRPSLSSPACSHRFPSFGFTIKYQLHFRLI